MLAIAGNEIAETAPWTAVSAISIHSSAVPVITRKARKPWEAADATLDTCSTRVRGNRSEITPPHSSSTIIGIVCAASTCPSAGAESVMSSTAKASAMLAIITPSVLTNRDAKYHAKLRSAQGRDGVGPGHDGSPITKPCDDALTWRVPSVRGGRACSCSRAIARRIWSIAVAQVSGDTQVSMSEELAGPFTRWASRRTISQWVACCQAMSSSTLGGPGGRVGAPPTTYR